jgi:uncharacterized tellurite resistance protein B-like protein
MDAQTRRHICELVAGIIATDKELHPAELEFLLKTFATFGIAKGNEDEAICPAVSRVEAAKAMAELPPGVRREAMGLLVQSAVVDGKVVPAEREYLVAVSRAADFSEDELDALLTDALDEVGTG